MSDGYTPREGTAAHKIIEFLRKQPQGASFTGAELEAKLKIKTAAMALRKAVEADVVVAEKRGNAFVFSLPAPPPALRRAADDRLLQRRGHRRLGRHAQHGRQRHVHARPDRPADSLRLGAARRHAGAVGARPEHAAAFERRRIAARGSGS